jgi:hypothetical protein
MDIRCIRVETWREIETPKLMSFFFGRNRIERSICWDLGFGGILINFL